MWTVEQRRAANRAGLRYPSDRTDEKCAKRYHAHIARSKGNLSTCSAARSRSWRARRGASRLQARLEQGAVSCYPRAGVARVAGTTIRGNLDL